MSMETEPSPANEYFVTCSVDDPDTGEPIQIRTFFRAASFDIAKAKMSLSIHAIFHSTMEPRNVYWAVRHRDTARCFSLN